MGRPKNELTGRYSLPQRCAAKIHVNHKLRNHWPRETDGKAPLFFIVKKAICIYPRRVLKARSYTTTPTQKQSRLIFPVNLVEMLEAADPTCRPMMHPPDLIVLIILVFHTFSSTSMILANWWPMDRQNYRWTNRLMDGYMDRHCFL